MFGVKWLNSTAQYRNFVSLSIRLILAQGLKYIKLAKKPHLLLKVNILSTSDE